MIVDALIWLLNKIIQGFLLLRPEWTPTLPDSVKVAVRSMMALNEILPISEVLACVSLLGAGILAFVCWKWVVKLIDWVADVIP